MADRKEIERRLIELIAEDMDREEAELGPTTMKKDLDMDSLDEIEIVMSVEDEFELSIPDEVAEKWQTLDDVINYVVEHTGP